MFAYGEKYKCDKITKHGYHRFYDTFLLPYRYKKNIKLFEIGIDAGRSLKLWMDFMPYAKIYGMDKDLKISNEKFTIFQGDQSSIQDLNIIINEIKKVNIIIDDGSHVPRHQILSFNYLFKNLLDFDGIYIIEDIETSYWTNGELYEYPINVGYNHSENIVKIFRDIADIVNREFLTKENIKSLPKIIDIDNLKYISSITFGGNCIIIKKMSQHEYKKYGNRKYRFKQFL
jgi:hypothetical protein